jgi:hypothetical protein
MSDLRFHKKKPDQIGRVFFLCALASLWQTKPSRSEKDLKGFKQRYPSPLPSKSHPLP